MATKRVTLTKSNGTSSSFDFTIPEKAGTYNLKFTLDSRESKSQTISGTGVQNTAQSGLVSAYYYSYSVNIGLGATLVTISPSTVSGTTNTANYNSSTGVVSGTIYSMLKRCSATLSWKAPKVIDAGNIVVNDKVHTYRLSFGTSNGSTINVGTFTTPAIEPPEENFSITTPSFSYVVNYDASAGSGIVAPITTYTGSGTSSTVTYTAKNTPTSVTLNGVTLTSTKTEIATFSSDPFASMMGQTTATVYVYATLVGKVISVYAESSASAANAMPTVTCPSQTYTGVISY